jgi:uncharacterized protein (UPF0332 family)
VSALLAAEGRSYSKHSAVERSVHRDLVKTGRWSTELGAAFSWLANLRYTGDYGGGLHVGPEDAAVAFERAGLIVEAARTALAPLLQDPSSA